MTVATPLLSRRHTLQLGFAQLALALGCGADDDAGNAPDGPLCDTATDEPAPSTLEAFLQAVGPVAASLFEPSTMSSLAEVRDAWLATAAPTGADAEILAVVAGTWPILWNVPDAPAGCVGPRVRGAVLADLANLRTVDVEGWTLSPTELQVVTVATLYHEATPLREMR